MKTTSAETITRQYFALSNQADLNSIRALFQGDATYSSNHTGLYYGVDNIMQMMEAFFQRHVVLHWQIDQLKLLSVNTVEVKFTLTKTPVNNDSQVISGTERLVVVNQQIRHIEVS